MSNSDLDNHTRQIMQTALGFREAAALLTAIKLDLFERFGRKWKSPDQVANGEDIDGLTRLCRVLAGLDLLEQHNKCFRNTVPVDELLTSSGTHDLRAILNHFTELYEMWGELDEAVRQGQTYQFEKRNNDTFDEAFTEAMEARAQFCADELVDAIGGRIDGDRILDLGGGSGVFARALLKADPNATGVVADQYEPLTVARRYIVEDNLDDRLNTRELDLLEDKNYGTDFDLVLISAILHIFGPEDAQTILDRSYDAISPGGRVVVRDYIVHDDHAGPLDALLFDVLMYLATDTGQVYTEQDLRTMMTRAGFHEIERINLPRSTDDLLIATR